VVKFKIANLDIFILVPNYEPCGGETHVGRDVWLKKIVKLVVYDFRRLIKKLARQLEGYLCRESTTIVSIEKRALPPGINVRFTGHRQN